MKLSPPPLHISSFELAAGLSHDSAPLRAPPFRTARTGRLEPLHTG
jgi:hypothetical protein